MSDNPPSNPPPPSPPKPPPRRKPRKPTTLTPEEQQQALHLFSNHYGTRTIARRLGRDRKTVRRFLHHADCSPSTRASTAPPENRTSKLDPFRDAIGDKVDKGLTTTRILREIRELGYTGGRSILNALVRPLRSLVPRKPVKRRFETRPGREMQVDWSVYTVPIAGNPVRIHVLACVLAFSRLLYIHFFRNERQSSLFEGLVGALEAFKGAALRVVFDNMATVVLGRVGPGRRVIWHPRLLDLARHYGWEPFACKVRDPDRKGKDERVLDYLEKDFVKGSSFASFDDLNQRAHHWCDETANRRTHGTTGRIPAEAWLEERDFLVRLPEHRFAVHQDAVREVGPASTLSIASTLYTVPSQLANHTVPVRLYADHFEVLDLRGKVAFSRRYVEEHLKGRLQIDPSHYTTLPRPAGDGSGRRLDELFVRRFPSLQPFVEGITLRMKTLAPVHLGILWRLAATYGDEAFLRAVTHVQGYRRFSTQAVRRVLEHDHPHIADPEITPIPFDPRGRIEDVDGGSLQSYSDLEKANPSPAPADGPGDIEPGEPSPDEEVSK